MTAYARRYRVPDPLCRHKRTGRVYAGDLNGTEPSASTQVCDREECIEDAKAWAFAVTRLTPRHVRDRES